MADNNFTRRLKEHGAFEEVKKLLDAYKGKTREGQARAIVSTLQAVEDLAHGITASLQATTGVGKTTTLIPLAAAMRLKAGESTLALIPEGLMGEHTKDIFPVLEGNRV